MFWTHRLRVIKTPGGKYHGECSCGRWHAHKLSWEGIAAAFREHRISARLARRY